MTNKIEEICLHVRLLMTYGNDSNDHQQKYNAEVFLLSVISFDKLNHYIYKIILS